MHCPQCGSNHLRTSRLRSSDFPRLLLFQYPVRCRVCRERMHVGLLLALNLKQSEKIRRRENTAN
jgi:hypothetical protein